jgi:hypothetical protein
MAKGEITRLAARAGVTATLTDTHKLPSGVPVLLSLTRTEYSVVEVRTPVV